MLRKFVIGVSLLGCNSLAAINAAEMQFTRIAETPQAKVVTPASWESGQDKSVLSPDVASGEFGKFKPCSSCSDLTCDTTCCDGASCDGLGCDGCGNKSGLLGLGLAPSLTGLIKRSEHCYDDFISPITNPVYFEDPRQLTEVRGIFIDHKIPSILGNPTGHIQLYAMQIRVRLTERLSLIAVKDGFIVSQSVLLDDGWADLTPGLKYSLYRNAAAGQLLSLGARFEAPVGTRRTLQGNGDGVLDVFLSGGTRFGAQNHYLTTSGFVIPMNSSAENQMWYWSNHLDRRLGASKVYALAELNWYNYTKSGKAFPAPVEGGDLFNLGATGVAGNNLVTNAYGLKYKPNGHVESGVAFEFPLTERKGLLDNRLTADLILRF